VLFLLFFFEFSLGLHDSVLLENIKALTFTSGKYTNGRRTSPIPQLECVGGSAMSRYELYPKVVQCTNVGSDGIDVQWKCEADLSKEVKFGETIVNCEGYNSPNDPYILAGSCSLEYHLDYAEPTSSYSSRSGFYSHRWTPFEGSSSDGANIFLFILMVLIIFGILYQCQQQPYTPGSGSAGHYGGGGGGGSGPYYGGGGGGSCSPDTGHYSAGWRPGFWSGLGGGSLLGYLLGSRSTGGYRSSYYGGYGSGLGGGGWSSGRSSFGGGFSGGSRSASAFASTRRR